MEAQTKKPVREMTLTRIINAPRELVWELWTEQKHVQQWWGPKPFTNPVCKWDAKPGSKLYVEMKAPDGVSYPMDGEFKELLKPEKIVFTSAALDGKGKKIFEILNTISFVEEKGKTKLTVHAKVTMVTSEADQYLDGMNQGWNSSIDKLEEYTAGLPSDRELYITRLLNAPVELVWELWTNPEHIKHWWGPNGFTNTIYKMDVKVGGEWDFTMHSPDGTDYRNTHTYEELEKNHKIVLFHVTGPKFRMEVRFTPQGDKTMLTIRSQFESAEQLKQVIEVFKADVGLKQNVERLEAYIGKLPPERELAIMRQFNAPRALVFKAWTEPERFAQWWGPRGPSITIRKFELKPGGVCHYSMKQANGTEMWGKFVYRDIVSPEKLVFVNSFSDKDENLTPNPYIAVWPLEMLNTLTFLEHEGKTTLVIKSKPINAKPEEIRNFESAQDAMKEGFKGTFEKLDDHLGRSL